MNRVTLYGHVGGDPDLRFTNGGVALLKISVATNEPQKKNDEWVTHTEWHNVTVWGRRAEGLARVIAKGSAIIVEGALRTSSWEDADGKKRYRTEIHARDVHLVGRRSDRGSPASSGEPEPTEEFDDKDIPF